MLTNEMRNQVQVLREQGKNVEADKLEAALNRLDAAFSREA